MDTIDGEYGKITIENNDTDNRLWNNIVVTRLSLYQNKKDFRLGVTSNNTDNSLCELFFSTQIPDNQSFNWDYSMILRKNGNQHQIKRTLLGSVASLDDLPISKRLYEVLCDEMVGMCNPDVDYDINNLIDLLRFSEEPKINEWLSIYDRYITIPKFKNKNLLFNK
ncbi:MAG: hypothetical protein PHX04_05985 [Bacilli bacterium]|nr:hypothetical protein [Bacilli bacterium]